MEQHVVQEEHQTADSDKVLLLRFGAGEAMLFRSTLLECPQLRSVRNNMELSGYSCDLAQKALVFVKPEQCPEVMKALCEEEVHPFHVIINESNEYLLEEVLSTFPCRKRPR